MTEPRTLAELVARVRAAPTEQPTSAPAPIGAGVATYATTGTELITSREIATVAGKLARHKSENKQTVGRAMLRAIKGEVWAGDGHRNTTMYQIAAELIEEYPNLDPSSVCLCFSAAISNAQLQGSKYTEEKLLSALERVQDERQNRLNMIAALGGLVTSEPPVWPTAASPAPVTEGGVWEQPAPVDTRAAELNAAGYDTLIIRANGDFYLRTPDRGTFDWKLSNTLDLRVKMMNLFGRENGTVVTHQDDEFIGVERLCETYARVADTVVHDYSSPSTTYAPATCTLHVGLPATLPAALFDPRIEAWLQELAGGRDGDLKEMYDWIASTTREYIDRPAAAIVISGARDAGKSLWARALAGTWGVLPVKLANAVERFNGALLSSPFWHADERMPEEMTEACFREVVPERVRLIEPKGREKVELRGCGRLVFTINSVDDLHVGTSKGPDAVDAVAGRIAFFDCSGRSEQLALTQNAFRPPGSFDLDIQAIIGHLRWVQDNIQPREQRFLGARLDNTEARALVLNQGTRRIETIVDAVCDYLANPLAWEKTYRQPGQYSVPGAAFPLVTRDGNLYVWASELAARIGVREFRALDSLLTPGRVRLAFGPTRGSYRAVDLERLLAVRPECAPDMIVACSGDTHVRLGLAIT